MTVYELDAGKLNDIAKRINSPTADELGEPLQTRPDWIRSSRAFRTKGIWD